MKSVVGVFLARNDARRALARLAEIGVPADRVNLLTPGYSATQLEDVPTTEAESPGVGQALGGVVGAAVGSSIGFGTASLLVPGVGPVLALGIAATALLGGMVGALAVGGKLDEALSQGVPVDELHVYEDALRQGRSVVVVMADDAKQAETWGAVLLDAGAETLDAARERWWTGLRDAASEQYDAPDAADFHPDQAAFRRGFEAALLPRTRELPYEEARDILRERFPDLFADPAFRRGYDRGRTYREAFRTRHQAEPELR